MCLIMQATKEINIPVDFFKHVATRNADGFGMMWIQDNKLKTYKTLSDDMDNFTAVYQGVRQYSPYIHFRMKTHGKIDEINCHPYYCGYGIYLMHNGILNVPTHDDTKSDTWHFVNDVLRPLFASSKNPHCLLRSSVFNQIMEQYCGKSSRLVFGDRGGFALINADSWVEVKETGTGCKGLMVSNSYAWSESSFRKTYYESDRLSKKERRRLAAAALGKALPDSPHPATNWVGEKFASRFEEVHHPFYIDKDWNVWERTTYGFIRKYDLDWQDVLPRSNDDKIINDTSIGNVRTIPIFDGTCAIVKEPVAKGDQEKADESTEKEADAEFELEPSPSLASFLLEKEDKEEEESFNKFTEEQAKEVEASLSEFEESYIKGLVTNAYQYTTEEVETLCFTDPVEAAVILNYLLKRGKDDSPMDSTESD